MRKTTCGWKFLVLWKDGSETWVPLRDMKESHPIEVAEYAKSRGIDKEPAFAWWLPSTLRKSDIIISAINTRIRKNTHKYGIEIPRNIRHARELYQANGNDFWGKEIGKEMTNVGIAFEIIDESQSAPIGWSKESGHLVFDVQTDFSRKARWVLDGHQSSHLFLPREGHLLQLFHMFAYLKRNHNSEMVFDPSDPVMNLFLPGEIGRHPSLVCI